MSDKCLMAASLAVLVFHPSSSIKCFKSSQHISPDKQRPSSHSTSSRRAHHKKVFSKSEKTHHTCDRSNLKSSKESASKDHLQCQPNKPFQSVSELGEGEPAMGVLENIFRLGWNHKSVPVIEKVLRVHNTAKVLYNFEEYREMVQLGAAKMCIAKGKERCLADGNEVLGFYGTTLKCHLGYEANSSICGHRSCSICSIIGFSFWNKGKTVCVCNSSGRAHKNTMKHDAKCASNTMAILVSRVIAGGAGRIANYHGQGIIDSQDDSFDSFTSPLNGLGELIILDPRSILPCFVIVYRVK
ncbi:hypothetical protein IFM89_019137 [Coptis chinensis]|uniref:Uncharacterized protein n=1 Tax=Coptis chinensis TaxID=261450 RepID=A0A835H757_9MAGN|nr:hypothetical protein IFM89_019137 [Coptis chinensis]